LCLSFALLYVIAAAGEGGRGGQEQNARGAAGEEDARHPAPVDGRAGERNPVVLTGDVLTPSVANPASQTIHHPSISLSCQASKKTLKQTKKSSSFPVRKFAVRAI